MFNCKVHITSVIFYPLTFFWPGQYMSIDEKADTDHQQFFFDDLM